MNIETVPPAEEPKHAAPRRIRREVLYLALSLALLGYACSRWVIMPVQISGESMAPSYEDGQPNFINKLAYRSRHPQRGDYVGGQYTGIGVESGKRLCRVRRMRVRQQLRQRLVQRHQGAVRLLRHKSAQYSF